MIARSGLDMAACDALAKAATLPLAVFLGGSLAPTPAYTAGFNPSAFAVSGERSTSFAFPPSLSHRGPRVRIHLPPAASQSLVGLYLRGSRTPAFRAVWRAAFPARSAETRGGLLTCANLRKYLS